MKFSEAKLEDLESLSKLLSDLFNQEIEFSPDSKKQLNSLKKIISNKNIGKIYTAKIDKEIAGMVSLVYTESTALGGRVALLEDMIIKKEFRGAGIGSKLIDYAINEAKKTNCMRITLLTDKENLIARKFYESKGFKQSEMIPFRLKL